MSDKLRDEFGEFLLKEYFGGVFSSLQEMCNQTNYHEMDIEITKGFMFYKAATERAARICDSGCCEHTKAITKVFGGEK